MIVRMSDGGSLAQTDRYAVVEHMASGGMGELHLARATNVSGIDRLVVTKRLRADMVDDERAALMLVDEARIAATLYHRNLVQVIDVFVEDGHVVLVLDYFPSINVAQLLDALGAPLPLAFGCAIVTEVAAGLHYAHERIGEDGASLEILHRDVSLPNILVGDHGHIKLTDFGIAKARSRLYVTRSAKIKGKLGYMAPEQIRGATVDRRVDVFALGVVLFEVATNTPLFTAASDYETMRRILDAEVPAPTSLRPEIPAALERVILRAVAADPASRFATAAELASAVHDVVRAEGWLASTSQLAELVRAHVPPGLPAWRRAAAMAPSAWTARTTMETDRRRDD